MREYSFYSNFFLYFLKYSPAAWQGHIKLSTALSFILLNLSLSCPIYDLTCV